VRAAGRGVGSLLAEEGYGESVSGQPDQELVHQVEIGVAGPADSRVVSLALAVVFAAADVDRDSPLKTGNAVPGVKTEPQVADLKGG
jgi:hypothetical protein